MFDRETAQSLLAQLPVPTSGNKLSSDSEDAKAFARAASKILEYYHLHPVDTAALIPVQEMGQIRMADLQDGGRATAIVIAPLSSKAAAKRPRTDPGHSVLMKGSHAGKAVAQFAFGGRGALVDVGDGGHVLVLRGKGKLQVDGKTQQAADPSIRGYCFCRVNPKSGTAGSSGNEKTGNADKLDHFSLYHAVLAPNSEAEPPSAAPDPATLPAGLASGPLGSLEVGHPFASALRETNVAVVEKMLRDEPRLAQAMVCKPEWTPAPFEWSVLSEALFPLGPKTDGVAADDMIVGRALNILAALLQHGARVDARDSRAGTPLHEAAKRGNEQALERLLDGNGAEEALWAQTKGGWLPVNNASHNKREGTCRALIKAMLWSHRSADRSDENATIFEGGAWPKPRLCDTELLEHMRLEERDDIDSILSSVGF